MNINVSVPFLINTSDSIVRGFSTPQAMVYLLHAAGKYCILFMLSRFSSNFQRLFWLFLIQ